MDGFCGIAKVDNALIVEAMAIRRGIKLVIKKKYQKVVVEMDSKVVHYEIVKEKMDRNWRIWPIIKDIRRMLNQIQEKQVKVIRRNANRAADW